MITAFYDRCFNFPGIYQFLLGIINIAYLSQGIFITMEKVYVADNLGEILSQSNKIFFKIYQFCIARSKCSGHQHYAIYGFGLIFGHFYNPARSSISKNSCVNDVAGKSGRR
jgi:hypothetical protein